jgi:hypothetical protein
MYTADDARNRRWRLTLGSLGRSPRGLSTHQCFVPGVLSPVVRRGGCDAGAYLAIRRLANSDAAETYRVCDEIHD